MIKKTLLLSIFFLVIFSSCLYAEEAKKDATPIVVNGDKVQFDHANKKVRGTGNVSVTYKDIKMTCEVIVVDIEAKKGIAEGNVILYQDDSVFKADKVIYNFEDSTGHLVKGSMRMIPWYGKAKTIDKIEDKVFKLNESYTTTCDYDKPHYRIEARTIKVYLNDRVTAWHVLMYVGDTPVMYIPYYNHPLEDNMPPVTLVPGRNKEWGTFLLSAWRYYFHPDSKGHVHIDWRSRRGHAQGVDYKYGLRKFGNGYFRFYYLHHDKEPDESQELGTELPSKRWRVQLRHKWPVDENTFMVGEYHRLSDQVFIKDYFYREEYEFEEQPSTYLMLKGAEDQYVLTFLWRKKVNDFFTVTERLPEAKLNIRTLKLFNHLNLYYANESSFVRLNVNNKKDVGRPARPGDNYDAMRIDSYNKLSYPFQLLGFLNINPFVGTQETFYTEDAQGNDNITRYIFTTGADLYTRFYKIYNFETDFLNLDIHKIRHLIIPSAKYAYLREPNLKPGELLQFDEIDALGHKNMAELSLQHKLQTKRSEGGTSKTVDLLTLIISSDYIVKDDSGRDNELVDYVEYDLEIQPYNWMSINVDASLHRRKRRFDSVGADLGITPSEDLTFIMGYRYAKHESTQLTSQLTYDIYKEDWKKNWSFQIYERYEIQEKLFQEQQYSIIKDLHCWTSELTCRVRNEKDYDLWLIFRLKSFPDIPFFFRTTYRGPEPGQRKKEKYSFTAAGS